MRVGVACNEKFATPIFLPFWQELVLISLVIVNHNVLRIKSPLNWGKSTFEGCRGRGSISETFHALFFLYLPKYWQNCDQIFCNVFMLMLQYRFLLYFEINVLMIYESCCVYAKTVRSVHYCGQFFYQTLIKFNDLYRKTIFRQHGLIFSGQN